MKIRNNPAIKWILPVFITVLACGPKSGKNPFKAENIKYNQYLIEGKRLYDLHCSNCHQKDGTGLVRLYPPLKNSDFLTRDINTIICMLKNGKQGEIFVNGISFNQPMPDNPRLTNLEIAEIATYIYTTWGNMNKIFTHREIGTILDSCDLSTGWSR